MNTTQILTYAQIGLSLLLIAAILLQQRGTGLSSTFGGGSLEYSTKRGAEKIILGYNCLGCSISSRICRQNILRIKNHHV